MMFVADVARKAMVEAFVNADFPEALAVKLEQLPVIFPIHMLSGGLALLLLPAVIAARRWPIWHRRLGRIAAVDVSIAGVTALPVAWVSPVSAWSGAGFGMQAIVWMSFLIAGIWHIRNHRRAQHRAAMLLMTATASGAIFFRLYLALWAIFGGPRHFVLFYAIDAWVAWLGPLAAMALWLRHERRGFAAARQSATAAR
ncbi:MAG: DUF2306 domain-containing protein [Sphingomicrobium sp.]